MTMLKSVPFSSLDFSDIVINRGLVTKYGLLPGAGLQEAGFLFSSLGTEFAIGTSTGEYVKFIDDDRGNANGNANAESTAASFDAGATSSQR